MAAAWVGPAAGVGHVLGQVAALLGGLAVLLADALRPLVAAGVEEGRDLLVYALLLSLSWRGLEVKGVERFLCCSG